MTLLEDRLLRIVELRREGSDSGAIAEELGLTEQDVDSYETSLINSLRQRSCRGRTTLDSIARRIGISPILVGVAGEFYKIKLPDPVQSKTEIIYQQIRDAIEDGVSNAWEIAEKMELTRNMVYFHAKNAGIELPRERAEKATKEIRYQQIRDAIESGASDIGEIAEKVGLAANTVRSYSNQAGVKLTRFGWDIRMRSDEEIAEEIRELLDSGEKSLEKLCKGSKVGSARLMKLARPNEQNIELPKDLIPWQTRPKLDKYVKMDEPPSLEKIGGEVGLTKERVRQYFEASGQNRIFNEKRRKTTLGFKTRERKQKNGEVLWVLEERLSELAREEGWAYEKAVEYIRKYPQWNKLGNNSLIDFVRPFERYEAAQEGGEKLSLQELSEGTKWTQQEVGKILDRVDVEPMYRKLDRHTTPAHKKEAIGRSVGIKMSAVDMGYFLRIPSHVVSSNLSIWGLREKRPKFKSYVKRDSPKGKFLTYRLASEVYEGIDLCGLDREEVAEILGVKTESVDYLLENRKEFESTIVQGLRVLYDDETIDTPYRRDF